MDTPAHALIAAFGGLTKTAKALGHKNVTTVQGWRDNHSIPSWRKAEIREAAERLRAELTPEAFETILAIAAPEKAA